MEPRPGQFQDKWKKVGSRRNVVHMENDEDISDRDKDKRGSVGNDKHQ